MCTLLVDAYLDTHSYSCEPTLASHRQICMLCPFSLCMHLWSHVLKTRCMWPGRELALAWCVWAAPCTLSGKESVPACDRPGKPAVLH